MELRYMRDVADDHGLDWEYTEKVLSSRDIDDWMRQGVVKVDMSLERNPFRLC